MRPQETLIGVSASYNIEDNPAREAAEKYSKDIDSGSSLRTIPIYRGEIGGQDNLKFLYTLNGVPIIAYTLLNAVDEGARVKVVGNKEVEKAVKLFNDEIGSSVEFIHEGTGKLSLLNSLIKLFSGNLAGHNYFVTGDIPFAKGYLKEGYHSDLTFDLNSHVLLERIEHVKRNFYTKARWKEQEFRFKEPNVFHFTPKGYEHLKEFSDIFYANRKNGGLPAAIVQYLGIKIKDDPEFRKEFFRYLPTFVHQFSNILMQRPKALRRLAPPLNFNEVNAALSKVYGIDFEFRTTHRDIFRMVDIDGLNNDWVLYNFLVKELELKGKTDERISRLRQAFSDKTNLKEMPLIDSLEDVLRDYTFEIDKYLPPQQRINFEGTDSFLQKNKDAAAVKDLVALLI